MSLKDLCGKSNSSSKTGYNLKDLWCKSNSSSKRKMFLKDILFLLYVLFHCASMVSFTEQKEREKEQIASWMAFISSIYFYFFCRWFDILILNFDIVKYKDSLVC